MATTTYLVFAFAQLAFGIYGIVLWRRSRSSVALLTMALPMLALLWDNSIVALGSRFGEGPTLIALTWPRYVGHALLTPIWIATSVELLRVLAPSTALALRSRGAGWSLYGAMALLGVYESLVRFDPVLVQELGLVYYRNGGNLPGPPVPALMMVSVVFVAGIVLYREHRWPWLALGAAAMFVAAGVSSRLDLGFLVDNLGEVAMSASFVATAVRFRGRLTTSPDAERAGETGS